MNLVELDRALKQLRLGGMASVLESRLLQAQNEHMAPIDLISLLISDELRRRALRHPARGCPLPRPTRHRQESPGPGDRPSRHPSEVTVSCTARPTSSSR